jgi:hypothetical protein
MKTLPSFIKIPVHSFCALITNSSSEIFVSAGDDTVQTVKEIINHLLTIGNSEFKADDLFIFKLKDTHTQDDPEYQSEESMYIVLEVKAKDKENKLAKETAKLLTKLQTTFSGEDISSY